MLVLCEPYVYNGEYEGTKFQKVILNVSDNGRYPQIVNCDVAVYQKCGVNLKGKEIELLYEKNYGRYRVKEIKVIK